MTTCHKKNHKTCHKKALHQIMKGCVRLNLLFFLFQVKIWFQNRRSKYKKMMKAPGGSVGAPPNMLTGQPLGSSSPPPSDSPMGGMHQGNTPNSQGQMSPGPSIGPPSNHSPQQHHQQQQQHHHPQYPGHHGGHPQQHPNGVGYGHVPQATPSPHGGDMSPSQHHMHSHGGGGGGSPPGWHSIHQQQDIKPPMNPAAAAGGPAGAANPYAKPPGQPGYYR